MKNQTGRFKYPPPPEPKHLKNKKNIQKAIQGVLDMLPSDTLNSKTVGMMQNGAAVVVELKITPVSEL